MLLTMSLMKFGVWQNWIIDTISVLLMMEHLEFGILRKKNKLHGSISMLTAKGNLGRKKLQKNSFLLHAKLIVSRSQVVVKLLSDVEMVKLEFLIKSSSSNMNRIFQRKKSPKLNYLLMKKFLQLETAQERSLFCLGILIQR